MKVLFYLFLSMILGPFSQPPKQFVSASVVESQEGKQIRPRAHKAWDTQTSIIRKDTTLWELITEAYPNVPWSRIVVSKGLEAAITAPGNFAPPRFDFQATFSAGSTPTEISQMLQTTLKQQFQLVTHQDTTPVFVYELRPEPMSNIYVTHRYKPAPREDPVVKTRIEGPHTMYRYDMSCTFPELAAFLQSHLNADVTDKTGLTGIYQFSFLVSATIGLDPDDHSTMVGPPGLNWYMTRRNLKWHEALSEAGIILDGGVRQTMPVTVIDSVKAKPQ